MNALAIIDMQPCHCLAARDESTLRCVLREIEKAMQLDWWIVLIELDLRVFGLTDESITHLLSGYPKLQVLDKTGTSAAQHIQTAAELLEFDCVRIVGVNTNSCIKQTVEDLIFGIYCRNRGISSCPLRSIEVVKDGCNTEFGDPLECWTQFPQSLHLRLV